MVPGLDVVELTPRPVGFGAADWRKLTKAQREEILSHVPSQAASSSSGPQVVPVPDSPVVSVPAVSAHFPRCYDCGGVHSKTRSRQTKQQSNNEGTSDAVGFQKVKAAERTIGTIIKPAIEKTDYVERNIVEFCCGENSKIGQSNYQRDACTATRLTFEDDVTTI